MSDGWKGRCFDVLLVLVFIIAVCVFVVGVYGHYKGHVLCDELFADSSYVNTGSVEPGYIKCCVEEFVDHELRERCEVLKR